jgi:neutral ceramidase
LQENILGRDCPVLHHTGPCGDQSPRHVTKANTFDEAARLGSLLGRSIAEAIGSTSYTGALTLACARTLVDLPARALPTVDRARQQLDRAARRLEMLRRSGANSREVRTAECDWFGAEEWLALAQAAAAGRAEAVIASIMPAEITLMRIGPWCFVGWPGEVFVEFALRIKSRHPNCYVISLANGELQGYLVTEDAVRQNWYEAMNSLFTSPEAGMTLVNETLELLRANGTA